jgi:hypothetical protein
VTAIATTGVWACTECRARFGAWLSRCPRCHHDLTEEATMPKITRTGGPSIDGIRVKTGPLAVTVEARTTDDEQGPVAVHPDEPDLDEPAVDDLAAEDPTEPTVGDDTAEVDQPARNASKAAWVDYAVAQGADRDEAEALGRDVLAETYGEA